MDFVSDPNQILRLFGTSPPCIWNPSSRNTTPGQYFRVPSPLRYSLNPSRLHPSPPRLASPPSLSDSSLRRHQSKLKPYLSPDYVKDWRVTCLVLTSVLFLAAGIWFLVLKKFGVCGRSRKSKMLSHANHLPFGLVSSWMSCVYCI